MEFNFQFGMCELQAHEKLSAWQLLALDSF